MLDVENECYENLFISVLTFAYIEADDYFMLYLLPRPVAVGEPNTPRSL